MNDYQTQLWNDLMTLVNDREAFYYVDFEHKNHWFRVFNYRLASYTDFCQPNALECRGHTFEINEEGKNAYPIRLSSHLFPKFFNYQENPFTMDVDFDDVEEIALKMDGSLISSYTIDSDLFLKSKGSLFSDQAIDSMNWLSQPERTKYKKEIEQMELLGHTVIFEFTAPWNRIVIGYEEPKLTVLGIRNRVTGDFVFNEDPMLHDYPEIRSNWTELFRPEDSVSFLKESVNQSGIEGYVCRMNTGLFFKLKNLAYLALHHTKDNINSPRRLFEAVLEEATDDMKSLFHDDPLAIKTIEEMELFVEEKYNHMVDQVERFYERNKHLDRKDYAILGQKELDKMFFGLAMNKYVGKEFSYKEFLKGKWKQLGLKDTENNE